MPQTLRWIIAASLLVQIAKGDAIPANPFIVSRYGDQSNIFRFQFRTDISLQTRLRKSVFASDPYGPVGFGRQVSSPKRLFLLRLPDASVPYGIGGQRDNGGNATLWKLLKILIGVNSGPCERKWTQECEHSFANPSYRPGAKKK
jgi:hypothetical protein